MRKVIASEFVAIDAFMVGPNEDMSWVTDNFDVEGMGKDIGDLMSSVDTILLGRVTYEIMANFWPTATMKDDPGADQMNNTHKIVFSKTLKNAPWGKWNNARVVKDNITEEIQKLKQQPGKDMVIYGSASIVQTFTSLGLIDEYWLWVHPVVLGSGKPLFKNTSDRTNLKLLESKTFSSGIVLLRYAPAGKRVKN